jgi:hypothetical protein
MYVVATISKSFATFLFIVALHYALRQAKTGNEEQLGFTLSHAKVDATQEQFFFSYH